MKRFLTSWWTVSITVTLVLIALFAFGLPLFVEFLRPWWVRVLVALFFVALWGLWFFLRRRKEKKRAAALAAELAAPDKAGEEAGVIATRMKEALANLKKASGKQRNYLYTRPWYVIIGPPGAGKTTALVNSGLRFPFSDKAVSSTAGTRNLDFWFADEAVLVDTAGRYTTQDSDSEVDSRGWSSLLDLLRRTRPFEPINGVFVAIPTDDLLRGDVREIDKHALIVRHRLHEIRQKLETRLPVYLLLTKSDLIAGFPEYFADLDVDGRRAVFGQTFDWEAGPLNSERVVSAFDTMTNEVAARQPKRLQDEPDIRRRSVILGFPSQLHELRAPLHRFIEGAFLKEDRPSGDLRGFYLTSGTQDGAALDRILDTMAQSFSMDARQGAQAEGRTFFLNRLLQEVAFKEAGLPIADASATRRQTRTMVAICAAIGLVTLALIVAWTVSFIGNREFQSDTARAAVAIESEMQRGQFDLQRVGESDTSLAEAVTVLDQLRSLPEGYAARQAGSPSLAMRFGLFQSDLSRRNVEAYHTGLRRILLPRVMLALENRIRGNLADPLTVYEPLKVYLTLGGHHPKGEVDSETVGNYMALDWAQNQFPGEENRPLREDLLRHLAALTEDDANITAAWPGRKAPLDANLVAEARNRIAGMSLADRAYAIMKQKAANPAGDFQVSVELAPGEAQAFADPDLVMNTTVPHFFTRDGFTKSYSVRLRTIPLDLQDELWVLGEDAQTGGIRRELGSLTSGISKRYASDYIAAWENVVSVLRPADYFNDQQAYRAFTRAPSPLKKILSVLRDNTTFEGGASDKVGEMVGRAVDRNRVTRAVSDIGEASAGSGMSADREIANHFRELHAWVGNGEEGAPIDQYVTLVREAFKAVLVSDSPGGMGDSGGRLAEAMAPLSQAALEVPSLLGDFAEQVASGGNSAQVSTLQTEVGSYWAENILPACQGVVDGNFPFDGQATSDAGITETRQLFAAGGVIDRFVSDRADSYLDRDDAFWRWRDDNPIARGFNPATPGALQKASRLRDMLSEGLPLEIALVGKGALVTRVELTSGGLSMNFTEASLDRTESLVWSLGGGLSRRSELKIYAEGDGAGEQVVWKRNPEGPWSIFRLFEFADQRNRGEGRMQATFNAGPSQAVFLVGFPVEHNPFGGGGVWSVSCPSSL